MVLITIVLYYICYVQFFISSFVYCILIYWIVFSFGIFV